MGRDRGRDLSRSPSYRRRYLRSLSPVGRRYIHKSRRDRRRSPYSYSRHASTCVRERKVLNTSYEYREFCAKHPGVSVPDMNTSRS